MALLKDQCHLKNVNAIAHFTDWIIAHVHVGALAWNGLWLLV
jgi:cytochrome c oxidase cbb3-type subunit I/II